MSGSPEHIDIILPCYNPLPGWEDQLLSSYKRLSELLPRNPIRIILVNDGSSKGVEHEDINKIKEGVQDFEYIHYAENRGKGYALREGVKISSAPILIYTDIDFPYKEDSFLKVAEALIKNECDIAAGIKDSHYYEKVPFIRKQISRFLRFLTRTFLRMPISDTQCGLKGFNRRGAYLFLTTTIDRYLFDLEFLYLASNDKSLRLNSIPVALKESVKFSRMNSSVLFREGLNFISILIKSIIH